MKLSNYETDMHTVQAGYICPCGCTPSVTYERGGEPATSHCCCGNDFAVGPDAERGLEPRDGFVLESEVRTAGWGDPVTAAWLVGPSVHPEPLGGPAGHPHDDGESPGGAAAYVDPVCGMRVDRNDATEKDLHRHHGGVDYYFCAKGCYLDFGDDPERFLDPSHTPTM